MSTSVRCADYGGATLRTLTALKMGKASSLGQLCSEVYIENPLFWKRVQLSLLPAQEILCCLLCFCHLPVLSWILGRLLIREGCLQML